VISVSDLGATHRQLLEDNKKKFSDAACQADFDCSSCSHLIKDYQTAKKSFTDQLSSLKSDHTTRLAALQK
jgi:hypothetical protein